MAEERVGFRFRSGVETGAILSTVLAADVGLLMAAPPTQHWVLPVVGLVTLLGSGSIFAAERREHIRAVQDHERDEGVNAQFKILNDKLEEQRSLLQERRASSKRAAILSPQLAEAALAVRDEIYAYLVERAIGEPAEKLPPYANDPRFGEYMKNLAQYEMQTSWEGAKFVKRARQIAGYLTPRDSTLDGLVESDLVYSKNLRLVADRLGVLAGVE